MLAKSTFWAVAFSGFLLVSGSPVASPDQEKKEPASAPVGLPAGYTRSLIHWKGVLEEGKPEVQLTGDSFDDIEAKAKALHSNYTIFAEKRTVEHQASNGARDLDTRQLIDIHCYEDGWSRATNWGAVWDGINYLKNLKGSCRADPAGDSASCGRVSCSYSSAIYYCNLNKAAENWQLCSDIGQRAEDVANHCHYYDGTYHEILTQGEATDSKWWSAIIGWDNC